VPCLVRPDLAGVAVDQVALMLVENDQRTDLKQSERAAGYAQLAVFDWTLVRLPGVPAVAARTCWPRCG
jgi:hypothetical protein